MAKRKSNAQDESGSIQLNIDRIAAGVALAHAALGEIAAAGNKRHLPDDGQREGLLNAWLQLEVTGDLLQALREKIELTSVTPRQDLMPKTGVVHE